MSDISEPHAGHAGLPPSKPCSTTTVSYLDQSTHSRLLRGFLGLAGAATSSGAGSGASGSKAASMSLNRESWPGLTFSDLAP